MTEGARAIRLGPLRLSWVGWKPLRSAGTLASIRMPEVADENLPQLMGEARGEAEAVRSSWESLDSKLVALLGFSGVLLALPVSVSGWWRVAASVCAVLGGALSVWGLRPRDSAVVSAYALAECCGAKGQTELARMQLAHWFQVSADGKQVCRRKAVLLGVAGVLLLAGASVYAAALTITGW